MSEGGGRAHVDVLVVGAGLSGIGAAYHLEHELPGTTWAILEARDAIGGTWDLFRFPGVRSDSDMHTLSYPWRPWRGTTSLAGGDLIREYVEDTARAYGIDQRISFGRKVTRASWSSADARWTVEVTTADGPETWTCGFLYGCTGYYDYANGYTPEFAGVEHFQGSVVHPQHWPADLDVRGRRVAVIGSGATAVTLVPALADVGADVTMVQRSPSWVTSVRGEDPAAGWLWRRLPEPVAARLLRVRNAATTVGFYELTRHQPRVAARFLRRRMRAVVGPEAVAENFTPRYDPWDQRLCVAPDSDFLHTLADGRARLVTDRVARFVRAGLELGSGRVVEADVVVTATGLSLLPLGGVALEVDGEPVDLGHTFLYRGCLLSGVPNLACCLGYVNASWTLRTELAHEFVCRVVGYLRRHGLASATPVAPAGMRAHPALSLTSGYVMRGQGRFPSQGDRDPWTIRQNWFTDRRAMRRAPVEQDMAFAVYPATVGRAS